MTFTNEQVTGAIKEVVAEKGDEYVYEAQHNTPHKQVLGISYSYDDCIVGCVIRKLDPELHAKMLEHETRTLSSWQIEFTPGSLLYTHLTTAFTKAQRDALRSAQAEQDGGHNWGEALNVYTAMIGASND